MARGNAIQKINYALAATLVAAGHSYAEVAPQVGAKTGESLRVGLNKRGVTLRTATDALQAATPDQLRNAPMLLRVANAANALQRIGERTRTKAANIAERLADSLAERKVPRNLEDAQVFASTLQSTVKTASIVHGWEQTTVNAIIMPGDTEQVVDAIDVESTAKQVENGNS